MPHELPLLRDLLVLLLAAVPIAFLLNRLRLPVIVGFMVTGILIGPYGFGLIRDVAAVDALAEIGVVLLLFTIGLEFSLRRIIEMKRLVLWGGGLQVLMTILLMSALAYAFGRTGRQAVFIGFLFALSSTAIVLKSYFDRAEIDAPHGRAAIAILLFQDFCVVPMMLLVPLMAGGQGLSAASVAVTLGTAVVAVTAIVFTSRRIVPALLARIVAARSSEVFVLFIVLVAMGTSWLTWRFGLSLALGAFIAGLVLSDSEYSHQIVSDLLPFRDVFNSIFFISIGMLLSMTAFIGDAAAVMAWLGALAFGKILVVVAVLTLLHSSLRVAVMAALGLAQIGEFSFILARTGFSQHLLSETDYQRLLAASILSMMATPFLIKSAPAIAYAVQSFVSKRTGHYQETVAAPEPSLRGHVVIVGYGLNGRNLARVLRKVEIPYFVLDLNPETVRRASAQGEPIAYGDSTRKQVLHSVALERARVVVLAISDPIGTRRTLALAKELNPEIHSIVRTRYMSELPDLYKLGAGEVIPEEFETSIEIFARVLRQYGIARNLIQQRVEEIRREGYQVLRGPSLPLLGSAELAEALQSAATETLFLEAGWAAVGKTLEELDLRRQTGATVITVVRDTQTEINPGPTFRLEAHDILVLLGGPEQIDRALEQLKG